MSKELTEQWRNGTLKFGYYYVKNRDGDIFTLGISGGFVDENLFQRIVEVFAPVPTYDQFVELTEKADQFSQMEKKVDELEKQLTEAEEVIHLYFKNTQNAVYKSLGMNDGYYKKAFIHAVAKEYLKKYGVEK